MNGFAMIGVIVALLIFVVCAVKESKTTALYKYAKVYGRIKAYLFVDMLLAGIAFFIYGLCGAFVPALRTTAEFSPVIILVIGIACLCIAALIFITSKKKCPAKLEDKLFISMLISGLGVAFKVSIFFLPFIWKLGMPSFDEMVDESGNTVYVHDNMVYNASGDKIGEKTGRNTYVKKN